jgi:hypothetical protein
MEWVEVRTEQILDLLYTTETSEITLDDIREWYCEGCKHFDTRHWTKETYEDVARELGYLIEPEQKYEHEWMKIREVAVQGKYHREPHVKAEEWGTICEDFDDESDEKKKWRRILVYGGKCLKCQIPCNVTWGKVFCKECYGNVLYAENKRMDTWDSWVSVNNGIKMAYRNKLKWLGELPAISDANRLCVYCGNYIESLYYTWWFGIHKRICAECMEKEFSKRGITWEN